ncbi:MAG: hypothetical protein ACI8PZ_001803 [Myxococcota bacterium]|jgi:uncharacterized protein YdiU (UPF0061 family)
MTTTGLSGLRFDDRFRRELPGDPRTDIRPRQVPGACWSPVAPTAVAGPSTLAFSREAGTLLGLTEADAASPEFAAVFGGNSLLDGMAPYAARYGGHQFGHWAGQLGDGRAMTLGEALHDGARWEVQLKGAGPTPYSRSADGRAVLRSSIREFLCSEAMFHLGVPTTRALSLVGTGDSVLRDMLYDGNAAYEPGAVVCRLAPSFLRLGSYEILAADRDPTLLRTLVDHTIRHHFPELGEPTDEAVLAWLAEVSRRTAVMIVHWLRVGFVHGVMNTDNLSVLGLTIDYGPYGWLDAYDPAFTPNTTDLPARRYRYAAQPQVALWNLERFASALTVLGLPREGLVNALQAYVDTFRDGYARMMADKLGISDPAEVGDLTEDLLGLLGAAETDWTLFFRALATVEPGTDAAMVGALSEAFYAEPAPGWADWLRRWLERVDDRDRMQRTNPQYVLRNFLGQEAIDAAHTGDLSKVHTLFDVMRSPYTARPEWSEFSRKRPDWARNAPGCSMLSCSS